MKGVRTVGMLEVFPAEQKAFISATKSLPESWVNCQSNYSHVDYPS